MIPRSACPPWQSETPGQAAADRDGAAALTPRPGTRSFAPINQEHMVCFNGTSWERFGDVRTAS
jgi:hypothetical protein